MSSMTFLSEDFLSFFAKAQSAKASISDAKAEVAEKARQVLSAHDVSDVKAVCAALTELYAERSSAAFRPLILKLALLYYGGLVASGLGSAYAPDKACFEKHQGKREAYFVSRYENVGDAEKSRIVEIRQRLQGVPTSALLKLKERAASFGFTLESEAKLVRALRKGIAPDCKLKPLLDVLVASREVLDAYPA